MQNLNFVFSGMNHTRLSKNELLNDPTALAKVQEVLASVQGMNGHYYSFLFNAYVEELLGRKLSKAFGEHVHEFHSDSGGLQMVTRGMSVTPELKDEIYRLQGLYSNVAMSFDEIPIRLLKERSTRFDVSNRVYNPDDLIPAAKKSGQNLKRQLEVFDQMGTSTKPLLICQGNDLESYQLWLDTVLEQIPEEWHDRLAGLSLGSAALGVGALQDMDRFMIYANLDAPEHLKKMLHILGVGSVKRMLPFLIMTHSGILPDDLQVSYDSSTHTSGLNMGYYYKNGGLLPFGKTKNDKFYNILEDINARNFFGEPVNEDDFYDMIAVPSNWNEKYGDTEPYRRYNTILSFLMGSAANFTELVNGCIHDWSVLQSFLTKDVHVLREIKYVKDWNDYMEWRGRYGQRLLSRPVKNEHTNTSLEDFLS